jgi:HIV Tat-specific factor 1
MERNRKKKQRLKEKKKQKWYNSKIQSSIYIQGLPKDITRNEVIEFFSRAGVLRLDHETGISNISQGRKS